LANLKLSWKDKLIVKMRELTDAMRQASEQSVATQVQEFFEQIREINAAIVAVSKQKEHVECKMLAKVSDHVIQQL
jgi:hypothetical protein